jgi:hypothetical protein
MPQATMRLTDVAPHAQAVAATYVVGFRTALGSVGLEPGWVPERESAVGEAWFDPSPTLVPDLAGFAAAHHDAHLAKYTLASLDAARCDPSHRHLHLAAATGLAQWWINHEQRASLTAGR